MNRRSGSGAVVSVTQHPLSLKRDPSPRRSVRPAPKSAGSASLPTAPLDLNRHSSWHTEETRNTLGLNRLQVQDSDGPFADPLRRSSTNASDSQASTQDPLSVPSTPDYNYARRGSTLSTSSMSHSPTSPIGMYVPSTSRQRYSIASSSYANTIGDLSTSSMPLLRHARGGADEASSTFETDTTGVMFGASMGGGASNRYTMHSSSSRVHLAESSRTSYYSDDGSSVHSYPPKPRQRTGSTWTSSDNGEGIRSSWMREFEATGATGQVQRRGSADSRSDHWPAFVANSYVHQPIARPTPAYLLQLSSYTFPTAAPTMMQKVAPPRGTSLTVPVSRAGALGTTNPLAPLRKRLARSLAGSGGHLHTEVQLLLELIDALEHCITLFSKSATASSTVPRSTTLPSSSLDVEPLESPSVALSTASNVTTRTSQSKTALLDEVRLLVTELVELVPDAQRCLTAGQYGPLAFPGTTTTSRLLESLEKKATDQAAIVASAGGATSASGRTSRSSPRTTGVAYDWWPSRLARDCRNLLVEAGLPTNGRDSTVWLAAKLSEDANEEASAAGTAEGYRLGSQLATRAEALGSTSDSDLAEHDAVGVPSLPHVAADSARRDELLEQGKKRWEAYRQSRAETDGSGPSQR
ncbi:uncharacterized protein JCM15063_003325 [Sporobolomyces koalae]|uniref:uncharacterized protein n=1 Tax=Sporobolomyces koalae TaxID=500713 RepID=UPI0031745408